MEENKQTIDTNQLPVEESSLKERIEGFNEGLKSLLGKYELGLGSQPVFVPSKDLPIGYMIAAKPILFDNRKKEVAKEVELSESPEDKNEGEISKPE